MTFEVGSAKKYQTLDQLAKLLKPGDRIHLSPGETIPSAGSGLVLLSGMTVEGNGATVHCLKPGASAFSAPAGVKDSELRNVKVDSAGSGPYGDAKAFIISGTNIRLLNVEQLGVGWLAHFLGSVGCSMKNFRALNSRSMYGIMLSAPEPQDGSTMGPIGLKLIDGWISGSAKEFLKGIRGHRFRDLHLENVHVENKSPMGRTSADLHDHGKLLIKRCSFKGAGFGLGPLTKIDGQKLKDWNKLRLSDVLIEDTNIDVDNYMNFEAGIVGFLMRGGSVTAKQVAINVAGEDSFTPRPVGSLIFSGVKFAAPKLLAGVAGKVTLRDACLFNAACCDGVK